MPSIGQTWVLWYIGAVVETGVLSYIETSAYGVYGEPDPIPVFPLLKKTTRRHCKINVRYPLVLLHILTMMSVFL
jgi:hypothetical protein